MSARVVFNCVFGNGDTHLKNVSVHRSGFVDFVLTPAHDLVSTSLHFPDEHRTALELFDDFETEIFRENGFYGRADSLHLAGVYGMNPVRAARILDAFRLWFRPSATSAVYSLRSTPCHATSAIRRVHHTVDRQTPLATALAAGTPSRPSPSRTAP